MMTLLLSLFLLPQFSNTEFVDHPVQMNQGQIQIHLHGLSDKANWALGVVGSNNPSAIVAVDVQATTVRGDIKNVTRKDDWGPHLRIRPGAIDLDGPGTLKGALLVYLNVPVDTQVTVDDGGSTPIYTGPVHDSLQLHQGVLVGQRIARPQGVMNTILAVPYSDSTAFVQPAGTTNVGNMKALREHALTMAMPTATATDDWVTGHVTITPAGALGKIVFVSGPADLQAAVSQAARNWTFTPFREGEVVVAITILFKNGKVHSALWD